MSGVFPFALCLYFLRQVLPALYLELLLLIAWLASEPQASAFLCSPSAGVTDVLYHAAAFTGGTEGVNSFLYVCAASTLPSEPSSEPFCFILCI